MDVYRQAAEVIGIVRKGSGTAKALCLRKEMQKKRQTYAVVCETLRHYELLEDVLAVAEFFKYYPNANREFALCMAYDVVLGKGVNTKLDSTARAVQESASYLREAYWQVHKHHIIAPRQNDPLEETADSGDHSGLKLPRYARVNTLKVEVDVLIERLNRAAEKRSREEAGPDCPTSKRRKVLPTFRKDPIVPSLLVFPSGTDLHAHPAVRSGQLVLQDRASCLPSCVLLDAVVVEKPFSTPAGQGPLEYVMDACAAPGNKTTQLAALGAPHIKIMATERDEKRSQLLLRRVQTLGAADYVNVVNSDFFDLPSDSRAAAEGILLDPSCSASGVVTRVDVALMQHKEKHPNRTNGSMGAPGHSTDGEYDDEATTTAAAALASADPAQQESNFSRNEGRIEKLSRLQRKLLTHSLLSFENCRVVVYSTCSVHEEENEGVVREVLNDARVQARGWKLSNIMPGIWRSRGIKNPDDTLPLDYTIRCDPTRDETNGFFVARLDRELPAAGTAATSAAKGVKPAEGHEGTGGRKAVTTKNPKVAAVPKSTVKRLDSDDDPDEE